MKSPVRANLRLALLSSFSITAATVSVLSANAEAQESRRVLFGLGVEAAAKAQLLPTTGSPYNFLGSYGLHVTVRFLPTEEGGIISALRVGYATDDIHYDYAPGRNFIVNRLCARVEAEGLVPTRWPALWLSAGFGVDWQVAGNVGFGAHGNGGEDSANIVYGSADLDRAYDDLWAARRPVIPTITLGPVLRIPTRWKPLWVKFFVRQDLLNSYETPVPVTLRENFFTRHQVLVSQRPTHFGLSASYFF